MPGVLPVPDAPTTAVQQVTGSCHEVVAFTRRLMPTRLEAIPRAGTATCATGTPAPRAARSTRARTGLLRQSRGNSGNSPRRSSRIDQSGESQSCRGCLPFAAGGALPPLPDPLAASFAMNLVISSRGNLPLDLTLTPNNNQLLHLVRCPRWGDVRLEVLQPLTDGAQLLGIQFCQPSQSVRVLR